MKDTNKGRILIICTALLWGLAGICVKTITWGTPMIVAVRSIISLGMLLASKRMSDKDAALKASQKDETTGKERKKFLGLSFSKVNVWGALAMAATSILYVEAIKLTTAGTAIVLQYIAPILIFLYAIIFQKRKAKSIEILLTLAVFAGCVLTFADSLNFTYLLGNILALGSGFTFAAQIIIMNNQTCDTEDCTIMGNGICFLVCLPLVLFGPQLEFTASNIIWILVLSIFQYGLANTLFAKGIKKIDKIEGSLLLTIEPIFNPIVVAIFYGEKMGLLAFIGSAFVIIAVAFYSLLPKLEKKKIA